MITLPGPDGEPIAVHPAHVTAVQPYHTGSILWVDGRVLLRTTVSVDEAVALIGHSGGRSLSAAFREGYYQGTTDTLAGSADEQTAQMSYELWRAQP